MPKLGITVLDKQSVVKTKPMIVVPRVPREITPEAGDTVNLKKGDTCPHKFANGTKYPNWYYCKKCKKAVTGKGENELHMLQSFSQPKFN